MAKEKYAENLGLLLPIILYLGTHQYYWARSANSLARELSLDKTEVCKVLEGFPSLFRKSHTTNAAGDHFFALQARYANREGADMNEPEKVSYIEPVPEERLYSLISFVSGMAEAERNAKRSWIAVVAAIISAMAAIFAALVG